MPSLQDLRRRIKSVKNTQQITRAMKMVSAAKLRRAQESVEAARPYAAKIQSFVENLAQSDVAKQHPLFEERKEKHILVVVMTSDRGLCGAFNTNLLKRATAFINDEKDGVQVSVGTVGRKATEYFSKRGYDMAFDRNGMMNKLKYEHVVNLADYLQNSFECGDYDAVYVIFSQFHSVINLEPTVVKLFPFVVDQKEAIEADQDAKQADYIYEPDVATLMDGLLPRALKARVYQYLLETSASEHGARMTAMDNATNNAKDVMNDLTLSMNRQRQAAITTEIIEIVSGAEALG